MTGNGSVAYVNRSDGGVPKLHVQSARITVNGLDTDRHTDTVHHGGPDRAVCLFSMERILALQAEGQPIYPGSVGENLTLTGIEWESMVPGVSLDIADVRLMITEFTTLVGPSGTRSLAITSAASRKRSTRGGAASMPRGSRKA